MHLTYGALKPNQGLMPPFAICVVEYYIVFADNALCALVFVA